MSLEVELSLLEGVELLDDGLVLLDDDGVLEGLALDPLALLDVSDELELVPELGELEELGGVALLELELLGLELLGLELLGLELLGLVLIEPEPDAEPLGLVLGLVDDPELDDVEDPGELAPLLASGPRLQP